MKTTPPQQLLNQNAASHEVRMNARQFGFGTRHGLWRLAPSIAQCRRLAGCAALVAGLLATAATAQEWAIKAGGAQVDSGNAIARDGSGNILVTGYFQATATFGSGGSQTNLTAAGSGDIFVAKYDANGVLLWAVQAGSPVTSGSIERGNGVAVDTNGNVLVTGLFQGTATFGSGASQVVLTNAGNEDVFIAKYNSAGTLLWAKRAGGVDLNRGQACAVDALGNVFVTGFFLGAATFGESGSETILSGGLGEIFVAKYDAAGSLLWAQQAGALNSSSDQGTGVAVDAAGNAFVTGVFGGPGAATFGTGGNQITVTNLGGTDAFLAKYAPAGALLWVRQVGDSDFGAVAQGQGVAVDSSGNVFMTGNFYGTAMFGSGGSQVTLSGASISREDVFLAKFNNAGTLLWAQRAGGIERDFGRGVAADAAGNVWLTGQMAELVTFGSGSSALTLLGTTMQAFVAQFSPSGSAMRAYKIGGLTGSGLGFGIAAGSGYVTGTIQGTATFNGVTGLALTASGSDLFVAKYDSFAPADLGLLMSVDKPAPPEGDVVTFTLTLTNRGPSSAAHVRVTDLVPNGLTGVTVTPSRGTYTASSGLWDVGTVTNNTSATLTITGIAGQSSPITNRASLIHSDRADSNSTNNTASAFTDPVLPPGSSLVVANTANSGVGSLRNAIEFANANPNSGGPNLVTFTIPPGDPGRDTNGVCTIRLLYPIAPATEPVMVDALTQPGASNATWPPTLKIALTITNTVRGGSGLHISGGGSTVRGMVVYGFAKNVDLATVTDIGGAGIYVDGTGSNTITCNFLGTDGTGTNGGTARENDFGVRIVNSPGNTVGGTTPSLRNLFAYNDEAGVRIEGTNATNNIVLGNFIGTIVTGLAAAVGETGVGIEIIDAPRNIIGTTNRSAGVCDNGCNLISGNDDEGILVDGLLAVGQKIVGNFIGVNLFGTNALPNDDYGVVLDDAGFHVIGGASDPGVCSKSANLISGNYYGGLYFDGSDGGTNVVQGNFIGVNATGTAAIPNGSSGLGSGIEVDSDGNLIGGTAPGLGNLISGNADAGIEFFASDNNVVQGNLIGVAINGTSPLGNGEDGVYLTGANNLIGGTNAVERNVIAFNGRHGIAHNTINVTNAGNRFLGNSIFSNGNLGIDLGFNGVTTNDATTPPFDSDVGPNNLQNFPAIATPGYDTNVNQLVIAYRVPSDPLHSAYPLRVEFFLADAANQEGQFFLGADEFSAGDFSGGMDRTAVFTPAATVALGQRIVATTTDANGNTSEFSPSSVLIAAQTRPSLSILPGPAPGALTIRWPSYATNFVLQTKTNLAAAILWQNVTSGISNDGTWKAYSITNSPDPTRFFRLSQQP